MTPIIFVAVVTLLAFTAVTAFYRLFFHPLASIPGPKLAALTRLYEAYYDVYRKGQYTFKIRDLHRQYGPVIRISPYEVHVHDPDFFGKVYNNDGEWQKYDWAWGTALDNHDVVMHTVAHGLHKQRRAALGPYFSKAAVHRRHDVIQTHLSTLYNRLEEYATPSTSKPTVNIGGAVTALTYDVATDLVLGKAYGLLRHPDFNILMTGLVQSNGAVWRVAKHIRGFMRLLKSMPPSFVEKNNPQVAEWFTFVKYIKKSVLDAVAAHAFSDRSSDTHPTLAGAILDSKLSSNEKSPERVIEEISIVLGAGGETTANALRVILYHVYSNPTILQKLRSELAESGITAIDTPLGKLEQLQYLTAVLTEGLRLSPGVATRSARIAPDRALIYNNTPTIPAGTPVGMTVLNLHMDEEIHPDPKRFNPDRWLDGSKKPFFAPFSKGTRICLGMHLAWAELYTVLAGLVLRFDFEFDNVGPQDVECVSDNLVLGTQRINGMMARVSIHEPSKCGSSES